MSDLIEAIIAVPFVTTGPKVVRMRARVMKAIRKILKNDRQIKLPDA
jgi:hypothetical protein